MSDALSVRGVKDIESRLAPLDAAGNKRFQFGLWWITPDMDDVEMAITKTLEDFFPDMLKDIHFAENQISKSLANLARRTNGGGKPAHGKLCRLSKGRRSMAAVFA